MALFDNLRGVISNTSKDVTAKAKDVAATAKLKSQIALEKGKLTDLFAELGKAFYENPEDENIAALKDSITASKELIAGYEKQLIDQKGLDVCPNCGATIAKDVLFCGKCGSKIERPEPVAEAAEEAAEPAKKHCPVCDAEVTEDMAFCEVCGAKLED